MRSRNASRIRPRHAAIGALALGTTLSVTTLAPALAAAPAPGSSAVPPAPLLRDATLRLGQRADVRGRLASADAGRPVALQYRARGEARWHQLATTVLESGGRYRFRVRLQRSGALRIALAPAGAAAGAGAGSVFAAEAAPASRARRVAVAGRLVVGRRGVEVNAGAAGRVRGTLLPRTGGRHVVVEAGSPAVAGRRSRAPARARTATSTCGSSRTSPARSGCACASPATASTPARARAPACCSAFRATLASWYGLYGGALACGGTLGYGTLGVANKSLPCGTQVTLRYRGREITVPVIDRGPYVGGREWDLTGATARALGFGGVGVVWSTR